MKKTILISFFLGIILAANAQIDSSITTKKDTIIFKGNLWTGDKYSYKGQENIKFQGIKNTLKFDRENERLIANAETAKILSTILGFAGGFLAGYSITASFSGKPINLPLLGIGAGCIVVAIPISSGYVKSMKKAVRRFNNK